MTVSTVLTGKALVTSGLIEMVKVVVDCASALSIADLRRRAAVRLLLLVVVVVLVVVQWRIVVAAHIAVVTVASVPSARERGKNGRCTTTVVTGQRLTSRRRLLVRLHHRRLAKRLALERLLTLPLPLELIMQ